VASSNDKADILLIDPLDLNIRPARHEVIVLKLAFNANYSRESRKGKQFQNNSWIVSIFRGQDESVNLSFS
tara:strand:- start:92 stop:304 length:213 start_codon:yes stop_codon:yes gene_type:complete